MASTVTNLWRITAAGRAALLDGANRGTRQVVFTQLAAGSGSAAAGAANDGLTALRTPVDTAPLSGSTQVEGRLALQATLTASKAYQITEAGLMARIGDDGAEFLAAYWTDGGRAIAAAAAAGDTIVLAGVVDIQAAAADVDVTLAPALTLVPAVRLGLVALVDAAAIAWDLAAAPNAAVELGGNRTMANPANADDGAYYLLTVQQDATGGRTLAWGDGYVFSGIGSAAAAPSLADQAAERTKFAFVYEGGKMRCLGRTLGF